MSTIQYIPKFALVDEMERKKLNHVDLTEFNSGYKNAILDVLSFLDTLEVKEVDFDEEIEKCLKQHHMLAVGKKDFTAIAKHFFELGLKA
jgi:hypothetical protein